MKIFLNAGHGGKDPGAIGETGLKEADVTAQVVNLLYERMKLNGYPVIKFQQKSGLFEIYTAERRSGATSFISVHCNAATSSTACGVETWYYKGSSKGRKIAEIMQDRLILETGLKNRGIKPSSDLYVLKNTKAPAVLVELAFISNPDEEKLLASNPELFANALWEGIKKLRAFGLL